MGGRGKNKPKPNTADDEGGMKLEEAVADAVSLPLPAGINQVSKRHRERKKEKKSSSSSTRMVAILLGWVCVLLGVLSIAQTWYLVCKVDARLQLMEAKV
jgi:hypothetical protein